MRFRRVVDRRIFVGGLVVEKHKAAISFEHAPYRTYPIRPTTAVVKGQYILWEDKHELRMFIVSDLTPIIIGCEPLAQQYDKV